MPVTIQILPTREGRAPWEAEGYTLVVECQNHDSLEDVADYLADGGMISGAMLIHRPGRTKGERVIVSRRPIAFTAAAVARLAGVDWTLVEEAAA